MATLLGKRKRRDQLEDRSSSPSELDDGVSHAQLRVLMQKHFESQFKPLEIARSGGNVPEQGRMPHTMPDSGTETDWDGVSGTEDGDAPRAVQVVSHETLHHGADGEEDMVKVELKKFMTPKPPSSTASAPPPKPPRRPSSPTSLTEASHLKNDLALQSLLSSSSLFSSNSKASLQDLAPDPLRLLPKAKQKMPLAHRVGIEAKARSKEDTRRREARENGVVLERKKAKRRERERDAGVGGPVVGRMKGGTLRLSKKDVREIEGGGGGSGGRGGFGRGGKRMSRSRGKGKAR